MIPVIKWTRSHRHRTVDTHTVLEIVDLPVLECACPPEQEGFGCGLVPGLVSLVSDFQGFSHMTQGTMKAVSPYLTIMKVSDHLFNFNWIQHVFVDQWKTKSTGNEVCMV